MAFRSNYEAKRTWDPDSGWELRATRHGPEAQHFVLEHPIGEAESAVSWLRSVARRDCVVDCVWALVESGAYIHSARERVVAIRAQALAGSEECA